MYTNACRHIHTQGLCAYVLTFQPHSGCKSKNLNQSVDRMSFPLSLSLSLSLSLFLLLCLSSKFSMWINLHHSFVFTPSTHLSPTPLSCHYSLPKSFPLSSNLPRPLSFSPDVIFSYLFFSLTLISTSLVLPSPLSPISLHVFTTCLFFSSLCLPQFHWYQTEVVVAELQP